MASMRQLELARANIKGLMTRLNNLLDGETTESEAQVRAIKIEENYLKFEEVQKAIDNLRLEAVNLEGEQNELLDEILQESEAERMLFEPIYDSEASKARRIIDTARRQQQPQEVNQQNANGRAFHERGLEVKLPILKLPEFKGEYDGWLLFKDAFKSMIHENASLSPIQKFQHLRSALQGKALQVIGGLVTSAENYENAWDLLVNNYENTKLLINTHLNQLLDFPTVVKDKPASIKGLVVHIRTHLKALKTLSLPVDQWDELLIHILKNRMDYNTKKDWEEKTNRDKTKRPTLEEFLTFLSERCRTLEMIEKGHNKQESMKLQAGKKQEKHEKKVALASVSQRECAICGEGHAVYHCPKFLKLSISERIAEVKTKKLCMNCFGKGHFSAACKSSVCKKCQKKYNTLLHLEQEDSDNKTKDDSAKKSVVTHCATEENPSQSERASSSIHFVRKPISQVILSTARVTVENSDGKQQSCRVLLDPGSQSNLISEDLVRKLKLKCNKQNELIRGINKAQTIVARKTEVKLRSMHADYEAVIDCLVIPSITERLPASRLIQN